jgi:osmotically-inducible protein OsmY
MISISKKSDQVLRTDVMDELEFEPSITATNIGVLCRDGAVMLNGFVSSFAEKERALAATKRVVGVSAIADEIEVRLLGAHNQDDGEIALSAETHINSCVQIPLGSTQITVRDGWITAEGEVEWWYQKNAVANAVKDLPGVKGVTNLVAIKSAFARIAVLDAEKVHVERAGGKVVIRGTVRTYAERDEAERIAWAVSGVNVVENHLKIEYWGFGA